MTIKSSALVLSRVGPGYKNLCSAEVAHALSRHYNTGDVEEFCHFVGKLLNKQPVEMCCQGKKVCCGCDLRINSIKAMTGKGIETARWAPDWDKIIRMLKEKLPRPTLVVIGPEGAGARHAVLAVGYLEEAEDLQGVEVFDPESGDWKYIYLREFYEERVGTEYFPTETGPPSGSLPGKTQWSQTEWDSDDLRPIMFPNVASWEPPEAAVLALTKVLKVAGISDRFPAFQLRLGMFDRNKPGAFENVSDGVRFLLGSDARSLATLVDVFLTSNGTWKVGRLSTGNLVTSRISKLEEKLANEQYRGASLRFQEWLNVGLDVAFFLPQLPPTHSSSTLEEAPAGDREEVMPLGPRVYWDLEQLPVDKLLASTFIEKLKTLILP